MDQHFLTPLFAPASIIVFAGTEEERANDPAFRDAASLCEAFSLQDYKGKVFHLDVDTSEGSLSDLIHSGSDLAIIALPPEEALAALEAAGRMRCRAALVLSTGFPVEMATEMRRVARRSDMLLLGPNSRGFQRPNLGLNAGVVGPMADKGPLALVSQSGALTAALLDWARECFDFIVLIISSRDD